MAVDGNTCDQLLDALSGYVRRERFDSQTADMAFGPDPVMSWHWRLAYSLEAYAAWAYHATDEWGRPPDWSQHDKAARIVT
jgi:hypothetical protein